MAFKRAKRGDVALVRHEVLITNLHGEERTCEVWRIGKVCATAGGRVLLVRDRDGVAFPFDRERDTAYIACLTIKAEKALKMLPVECSLESARAVLAPFRRAEGV